MKKPLIKLLIGVTILLIAIPASGQNVEERLKSLLEENGKRYLGPMGPAFTMGVNSGTFRTAKPHKILGFDVTLAVSAILVPESEQTFDFFLDPADKVRFPIAIPGFAVDTLSLGLDDIYSTDRSVPTLFGENEWDSIAVDVDNAYAVAKSQLLDKGIPESVIDALEADIRSGLGGIPAIPTPPGIGLPFMPMIMPQASLGLPFGLELTLRGLPEFQLPGDLGTGSIMGYGVKIGLNQFIPTIPLIFPAVSVGYYGNKISLGDILDFHSDIINLQVSMSVPLVTLYGGIGMERGQLNVSYTAEGEIAGQIVEIPVSFESTLDPLVRKTVGIRLKLLLLSLNVDYNDLGDYQAISVGVGLTLR